MAHPKCFVVKSGVFPRRRSRLLNEINMDKVKATSLTRDGLDVFRHKQRLKMKGRQSFILFNEMSGKVRTENEKKNTEMTPPETALPSSTSISPFVDSKRLLVNKKSSNALLPIPHGFRFHSNGDERLPHRSSFGDTTSRPNRERPGEYSDLRNAPIHPRPRDGRYSHNPVVETLVWKDLRRPRFTDSSSDINFEFADSASYQSAYVLQPRRASEPVTGYSDNVREKPRHFLTGEKSKFKQNKKNLRDNTSNELNKVSWHIPVRQAKSDQPFGIRRSSAIWSQSHPHSSPNMTAEVMKKSPQLSSHSFKGVGFVQSEPTLRVSRSVRNPSLMPAQSSFNRKYGVSPKLLAKRKPILDGLKEHELKQASATMNEVQKYVDDIHEIVKEKTQEKVEKDPLLSLNFDFASK